jgi:hypothetical protein
MPAFNHGIRMNDTPVLSTWLLTVMVDRQALQNSLATQKGIDVTQELFECGTVILTFVRLWTPRSHGGRHNFRARLDRMYLNISVSMR